MSTVAQVSFVSDPLLLAAARKSFELALSFEALGTHMRTAYGEPNTRPRS